jgi:hypothetical protein
MLMNQSSKVMTVEKPMVAITRGFAVARFIAGLHRGLMWQNVMRQRLRIRGQEQPQAKELIAHLLRTRGWPLHRFG